MQWLKEIVGSLKQAKQKYESAFPPLLEAAEEGFLDRAKRLLAKGADVNAHSVHGETALHRAALAGHEKVVRLLLDHGAQVGAFNAKGETPLHYASAAGDVKVATMLLEAGADPNTRDSAGRTPRALASSTQGAAARRVLLIRDNRNEVAALLQQRGGIL